MIAEVGINHNGDMLLAKHLINISVDSGCDAVKLHRLILVLSTLPWCLILNASTRGEIHREVIRILSDPTERIQQMHLLLGHTPFLLIEELLEILRSVHMTRAEIAYCPIIV